jgi:hypothetical protein
MAVISKIRRIQSATSQGAECLATQARQRDLIGGEVVAVSAAAPESEEAAHRRRMKRYEGKPTLYAREVLGVEFWPKIGAILDAVEQAPYRTNIKSGHKIGKTHCCAALINYWFDVYDPGVAITTGASWDAMKDTVWSEVRMQRMRASLQDFFIGPKAPEIYSTPEHWGKLFSVNDSTKFQGKHRSRVLMLFDESVGVDREMFTVGESIFKSEDGFAWVCFCNPTDPSSQIYVEEQLVRHGGQPKWRTHSISSLDHPNIVAQRQARETGVELSSRQAPIPSAVSITQVDDWVQDWCLPIDKATAVGTDFEWTWPDGRKTWHRPQGDWEARCLGQWPSQAMWSVWSDYLFTQVTKANGAPPIHLLPELGADVARFGDDKNTVHTRWGPLSLSHGARQGLRVTEMAGWLIETAGDLAALVNRTRITERKGRPMITPQEIPMKVDDDGVGGGVVDLLFEQGFNVLPVNGGSTPNDPARYKNKRSELWFSTPKRALAGGVCFSQIGTDGMSYSNLDAATVARLKLQAMAPKWKMSSKGQRVVEKKEETKLRLGHSPDDMDALNLAYYEYGWEAPYTVVVPIYDERPRGPAKPETWNDQEPAAPSRRPRFGH